MLKSSMGNSWWLCRVGCSCCWEDCANFIDKTRLWFKGFCGCFVSSNPEIRLMALNQVTDGPDYRLKDGLKHLASFHESKHWLRHLFISNLEMQREKEGFTDKIPVHSKCLTLFFWSGLLDWVTLLLVGNDLDRLLCKVKGFPWH